MSLNTGKVSILLLIVNVMISNIPKLLTFIFFLNQLPVMAQEIWKESFTVPEKGIWGDEGGIIQSDFSDITTWTLEYQNIELFNADDYAKTVTTSGGRFEVRDINGEVTWRSEWIDISDYEKVNIQLEANETGSGTNASNKYLKAFYRINEGGEIPFETNSENLGNWDSVVAEQKEISGESLQIVVYISNHYSSDKVILDEVAVSAEEKEYPPAEPGDLVINEILFNPFPEGEDFVEIYNNSEKEIPLNKVYLASRDKDLKVTQIYNLSGKKYLLPSKSYIAITKDTNAVFPYYFIECPNCFQQVAKMPSYNNDEDYVVLLNENKQIIDEFHYNEKLHNPLLKDVEGISLERNSFTVATNSTGNWYSASTESGYGTPGYKNSQAENEIVLTPKVTFTPEAFSPNNDGYNDEYQIHYELEKPGYIANILIFDSAGRFVTQLAKNEILGTSGTFIWNGEDETGQRQSLGVYVVLVEIFNENGEVHRFKDGVVLTDILK